MWAVPNCTSGKAPKVNLASDWSSNHTPSHRINMTIQISNCLLFSSTVSIISIIFTPHGCVFRAWNKRDSLALFVLLRRTIQHSNCFLVEHILEPCSSLIISFLRRTSQSFNARGIFIKHHLCYSSVVNKSYRCSGDFVNTSKSRERTKTLSLRCLSHIIHVASALLQDERWPPSVGGVFPVRRWAEETARAGCGERGTLRVTFLRNGRSIGLF